MNEPIKYIYVFLLLILIAVLCFIWGAYLLIQKPFRILIEAFNHLRENKFYTRLPSASTYDFAYLYESFNDMAIDIEELIENNYRLAMLSQNAALKQLQAQINPHFLYNSFFLLNKHLRLGEYDEADELSSLMGKYFKYITKSFSIMATLEEEYIHALSFISIQQKRFGRRINFYIDAIPEGFADVFVPKLILQPLLENVFEHGLANKVEDGILIVYISEDKTNYYINIEDNGDDLTDDKLTIMQEKLLKTAYLYESEEMTGLLNVYKRMQIKYKDIDAMTIGRSVLGGLHVQLKLNKNKLTAQPDAPD